jgi:hypothetical protein
MKINHYGTEDAGCISEKLIEDFLFIGRRKKNGIIGTV